MSRFNGNLTEGFFTAKKTYSVWQGFNDVVQQKMELTTRDFALLEYLMRSPG
jgi:hypothetical protein